MKRASLPLSLHSFFLTHYYIVSPVWKAWCPLESGNFSCSLFSLLPCRAELHGRVAPIISTFPHLPLTPQPTPFPRPLLTFCQVQQDPHSWKIDGHTLCLDCVTSLDNSACSWGPPSHLSFFPLVKSCFYSAISADSFSALPRMLGLWALAFVCACPPRAFPGTLARKEVKKKKKEEGKLPGNLIWTHDFTYHSHDIWELVSAVLWAGAKQWFSLVLWLLNSDGRESACNAGDPGSVSGLGRSPGEGNGNPLQYSCLENFMDREVWRATVHGVTKSQTWLSD